MKGDHKASELEGDILRVIINGEGNRDSVVPSYALALKVEGIDWGRVNRAIAEMWSPNAISYIKDKAWKATTSAEAGRLVHEAFDSLGEGGDDE